jgi:glutaredoxin
LREIAMKCPKCGYVRKMGEAAPGWQCPSCGIAYAKTGEVARSRASREPGGSGRFTAAAFILAAVFMAWVLIPGLRGGSEHKDLSGAQIVMYSLTTCGYCNEKRAQLRARGIPFTEHFIDTDVARQKELFEKLIAAGYRGGGVGTPTFEVNGRMLPNNPSLTTIIKHI